MNQLTIDDFSLQAYCKIRDEGKANENETIVLDVFKQKPLGMTAKAVAKYLGWSINRVTGRITELKDKNLLVYLGRRDYKNSAYPGEVLAYVGHYTELRGNSKSLLEEKRLRRMRKILSNSLKYSPPSKNFREGFLGGGLSSFSPFQETIFKEE